jgi:hypothetical protein
VREQTRHVQRIQKTLTEANIRLDSVLSDIMGASGRPMVEAMIAGARDPKQLAALAGRGVKATSKELYDALHERLTDHHRFLLSCTQSRCSGQPHGQGSAGRQGPIFRLDRSARIDPRRQ